MSIDLIWILLGLPLAFITGWWASDFDIKQLRFKNRSAPKPYFKGLTFLLNDQQDLAIEAFTETVQNDPDTADLHFALGTLFRKRGEYEKAIRVHEHLVSRGDLKKEEKSRAQHELAVDFLRAGLLDRAQSTLLKLKDTPYAMQAQLALLNIYERSCDWSHANQIAQQLQRTDLNSYKNRQAHYLCEQALDLVKRQDLQAAKSLLEQAIATAPTAARPRIEMAKVLHKSAQSRTAYQTLAHLITQSNASVPLFADLFADTAIACEHTHDALELLLNYYNKSHALDVLQAVIKLQHSHEAQHPKSGFANDSLAQLYVKHMQMKPSLTAASLWLKDQHLCSENVLQDDNTSPIPAEVQKSLAIATVPLRRYRCAACGFEGERYYWSCPACQAWDSFSARRIEEL